MKPLPIAILKELCSCVGASLYPLCVPSIFGGWTRSDMNKSPVSPQGGLIAVTLV